MKTFRNTALFFLSFALLAGCNKNGTDNDDRTDPVIVLTSPLNGSTLTATQTTAITGTITDDREIYMVHIHISDNNTGALLIDIHRYPGTATYQLSESFVPETGRSYRIQVQARDRGANEASSSVVVSTP
ncbi:DUF4249 family protein [Nostoc ellipsosporum NOK]|nr:DUF4249 family protein [Nostoc ellipsosporum NOK]